jgi:hypothetical protein
LLDAIRGVAVLVEVHYVLGQHMFKMVAVDDQYPVQQLAA